MVERNRRDTLRRNWRNKSGQCERRDTSRRGFYSRFVWRVESSQWTCVGRKIAVSALLGGFLIGVPANALFLPDTPPSSEAGEMMDLSAEANYNKAVNAYNLNDFDKALNFAKFAADNGHSDAQVMTAHILLRGKSGIADPDKAAAYFRLAAEQLNPDAYMGMGELSLKSEAGLTPSDAMHWFSLAAQSGRQDAMRAIGEMYLKGQGVPPDGEKAQFWLNKAAMQGDGLADRKMADSLFDTDPVEALKYYEKAAASGDHEAAYIAAIMYEEKLEIRPNTNRMATLMHQAAVNNIPAAQADYGLLVYQGRGTAQNIEEAASWFAKSAEAGDSEGQFLYAFTLAKGEGVEQSYEDAYFWLLKSGASDVSAYDKDRIILRERLEQNVDPAIIARARARFDAE